ncbi:MAG: TerC/Alx family metal homeostasis membrane protein [Nitrososphaeraceae archaeon]
MEFSILNNDYSLWILFGLFVGVALAVDLGLIGKIKSLIKKGRDKPRHNEDKQPLQQTTLVTAPQPFKQALIWTMVWISLAGIFTGLIFVGMGNDKMLEFVTGYTLEKSLSVDNMFVFLLIFSSLGIPHAHQHKVLSVGIISAIAMRIPLILVGVSLLESFHWIIYIFGSLLLFTAIRMLVQKKEKKIEIEKNIAVRILRKVVPLSLELKQDKFFTRINGILYATPMLVALVIVEMTDLVFAVDSIPAVLAITSDPFIVITSNVFAILGLRSLYFLLAGMMDKFYYLKPGLIALLFFISFKMMVSEFYKIPIGASLAVIFGILGTAMILSLVKTRQIRN